MGIPLVGHGSIYTPESCDCMRFSSITMPQLVDQFRHVGGQIAAETDVFAGEGVDEAKLGGVQGLPDETESLQNRAQGFGGAAIGWVSQ